MYICVKFLPEYLNLTLILHTLHPTNTYICEVTTTQRMHGDFYLAIECKKKKIQYMRTCTESFFFFNFFYAHVLNRISIDQHSTFLFLFIIQNTLAY